ncbi:hypothetical protein [Devosia faecipullorum]|uniref:hypothetical protein n=1 Tax=Devosia faecipullorum TaxID=2755039 RepID=UPI00187B791F|nr:hypothetical protein [Devosia faecipullorum]MBE7731961.1 hypothetical protein [Devosia faecipullorum]
MKRAISVLAIVASLFTLAGASAVLAQDGSTSCATPGSIVLQNIPPSRSQIVPSQQRDIAGYGRSAKMGGCKIELVCVATDSGDAAREIARLQCVAVRDTLTGSGFVKADIATSRQNPGNSRVAGAVYFTVH